MTSPSEDAFEEDDEFTPVQKRKLALGIAITGFAIGMFFWWGLHFHTFGGRIRPRFQEAGHFFWMLLGAFGVGYGAAGVRAGLKAAAGLAFLFLVAILIGVLLGHYR